eukprot:3696751-Amphidinium_carterae.1
MTDIASRVYELERDGWLDERTKKAAYRPTHPSSTLRVHRNALAFSSNTLSGQARLLEYKEEHEVEIAIPVYNGEYGLCHPQPKPLGGQSFSLSVLLQGYLEHVHLLLIARHCMVYANFFFSRGGRIWKVLASAYPQ